MTHARLACAQVKFVTKIWHPNISSQTGTVRVDPCCMPLPHTFVPPIVPPTVPPIAPPIVTPIVPPIVPPSCHPSCHYHIITYHDIIISSPVHPPARTTRRSIAPPPIYSSHPVGASRRLHKHVLSGCQTGTRAYLLSPYRRRCYCFLQGPSV